MIVQAKEDRKKIDDLMKVTVGVWRLRRLCECKLPSFEIPHRATWINCVLEGSGLLPRFLYLISTYLQKIQTPRALLIRFIPSLPKHPISSAYFYYS